MRIAHVLSEMETAGDNGQSPEFSLEFITSEGRVSRIKRGLRGARKRSTQPGEKKHPNHKENNLIHVTDLDEGQVKSVTIALITYFNGQLVTH